MNAQLTRFCSYLLLLFPWCAVFSSAGMDIIASLTALCFLLHCANTRSWQWIKAPWVRCMLAAWIYMLARGVLAAHPAEALRHGAPFIRYFVFAAALAFWLMRDAQLRSRFLLSLRIMLLFITADGFLQWATGKDIFGYITLVDTLGHLRLTGPFGQEKPILGIILVWLGFPIAVSGILDGQGAWRRGRDLALGILQAVALLMMIAFSGERMALMLALLGFGVTLLLLPLKRRLLVATAASGAALLVIMALFVPSFFDRQVKATLDIFAHWQDSAYGKLLSSDMKLAALDPVFGLGSNQFRTACPTLYTHESTEFIKTVCNLHPHNIYLEWLIENGVIGLALFVAFIACVARECSRALRSAHAHPLLIGWLVAFTLRIWPVGSTTGFFSSWGAPPFWLATGMLLAYAYRAREKTSV